MKRPQICKTNLRDEKVVCKKDEKIYKGPI